MFESLNGGSHLGSLRTLDHAVSRRSLLKYLGVGTAALGSASLVAACGSNGSGGPAAAGQMEKFTLASVPGDTFLLDALNVSNKDYARHNLDVPKHIAPSSGVQGFQLLVAGGIDGMGSDTLNLMATHANGSKGKRPVLVGFRSLETTYGIAVRKGIDWPGAEASFEEKMRSLKGRKVGVPSIGSGGDLQLKLALEEAGMSYNDVTPLAVGLTSQAIPNLNAERIDAYVAVQWTASRFAAQESGGKVLIDFSDASVPGLIRDQAVVAIAVREEMAQERPELVQKWLAAQDDASKWILANKDAAAGILNTTGLGGKGEAIAKAYMEHYATVMEPKLKPMFKVSEETVEHMAEIGLRFGNIKKGDITYEKLVPEFARA